MAKKAEKFFCPRCRQATTDVVGVGGSTFHASCLAGIESLILAHVPPIETDVPPVAESSPSTAILVDEPQA